jgi:GNAT superfamily N-acetyltransferase
MELTQFSGGQRIERVLEGELSEARERSIMLLLEDCFPDTFSGRIYFQQIPHVRFLLFDGDLLLGQVAVDFRVIRVGKEVVRILGVIDLCVRSEVRRRGYGTVFLHVVAEQARAWRAQHLVLFADRSELYLRNGYAAINPAEVKWLAIEERQSYGLIEGDMTGTLFAKSLFFEPWPEGSIDMLGYLF